MEFSKNMQKVMERAVGLAREEKHRYFMPEHMIYGLTFDEDFSQEYEAGGGDVNMLREQILQYVKEHAEKTSQEENVRLTADTEKVLYMAEGQARTCTSIRH